MKKNAPDWILASILAAAGFLVPYVFLGLEFLISLVLGGMLFTSGLFLFRVKSTEAIEQENDLESSLAEGKRKLGDIKKHQRMIKDRTVLSEVDSICAMVEKILAEVKRDPGDLKEARQFLSYYLDATITILNKYAMLSSHNVKDPGIHSSLERAENMLKTINKAFEKQLARLLTNDVMDLDIELSLLERTIKMEGLGE